MDAPVAVADLAASALTLLDDVQAGCEHREVHRTVAQEAQEAAEVIAKVEILYDRGDARLGVSVRDQRGQTMPQLKLGSGGRRERWDQLGSPRDDHPPEGVASNVRGRGQPLSERLGNGGFPGRHQTGDDHDRGWFEHADQDAAILNQQSLTGGVEVGMRLDGTPALAEALRYYEHVMAEANMGFVRDALLGELAESLYAEALTRWPLPGTLEVAADDATWTRLAEQEGVVLYERSSSGQTTLYSGRHRWRLNNIEGRRWLELETRDGGRQRAVDIFEAWLTREQTPNGVARGLCPATFFRTDVSISGRTIS